MWPDVRSWGFHCCAPPRTGGRAGPVRPQAGQEGRVPDLLLEIGTEELPPHDIAPALQQLAEGMRAALAALRIDAGVIRTYGAPRRLAVVCMGVASRQRPMVREVRGPAAQAAFDAEGRPTQAAIGFARAQGVPVERLQAREVEGKRYAVAVVEERPKHSAEVLPGALTGVVTRLSFSKMMRWGEGEARFARPIRWMVALLGRTVLRVEVAGVRAGRTTRGHRILGSGPRAVASAQAYPKVLKSSGVIVDQDERRRVIVQQTTALAKQVSGVPVLDSALLDELI
ncbi:MAG: glycine--tRNA ligase subunit beta, partial [Bacillati bacterium ANGP1]